MRQDNGFDNIRDVSRSRLAANSIGDLGTVAGPNGNIAHSLDSLSGSNWIFVDGTADNPAFNPGTDSLSFGAWIRPETDGWFFHKGDAGANADWWGLRVAATTGVLQSRFDDGTSIIASDGSTTVDDGEWHFAFCTWDAIANVLRVYVDGRLDGTGTSPSIGSVRSDLYGFGGTLRLGAVTNTGISSSYKGAISDVRIYDRALSESEVHDLYQASRTGYQDQFKRRYFPVSTTIEEPPVEETTGGLIRLRSPKQSQPSYKTGYAKSASESANPELWDGLAGAWATGIGYGPARTVKDLSGWGDDGDLISGSYWTTDPLHSIRVGSNQNVGYVKSNNSSVPNLYLGDSVSISYWLGSRDNAQPSESPLFNRRYTNETPWATDFKSGTLRLFYRDTDSNFHIYQTVDVSSVVEDDTESQNHLCFRMTYGDGSKAAVYINGVEVAGSWTLRDGNNPPKITANTETYWGFHPNSGSYWDGTISTAMVWNRLILDREVGQLYADPLAPFRQRRTAIYSTQATEPPPNEFTLTADVGSFTLTGTATGLKSDRKLTAETGAFTLTGSDATLTYSKASTLTAETGSFTSTGNDATLRVARKASASTGAFTLTGSDATLKAEKALTADTGAFTLTGTDTGLNYGAASPTLVAAVGEFTAAGNDASLVVARKIAPETGTFTETGNDAGLRASRSFIAATGAFTLDGPATNLQVARNLVASNASFTLNGVNVLLRYSEADVSSIIQATSASIRCPKASGSISCADSDGTFITP